MNFEKGFLNLKEQSRQKASKLMAAFVAAGIITFGPGMEGFKNLATPTTPEKYIEYVEKQPETDEIKAEMLKEKLRFLEGKFSSRMLSYLIMSDKATKEKSQNLPSRPAITGFEEIGIDNKDLSELWSKKFYPAGTIEGKIANIKYLGGSPKNVPGYNIEGNMAASTNDFSGDIYFYNDSIQVESKKDFKDRIESLDWRFAYEKGHKDDWGNQNKLSPIERVEFLHEVTKAFEKPGSFRPSSGYGDSINNPDKYKENYYKVREYWAELCEHYLTFPELAKDYLAKDEIALVKKWLQREDREFDAVKASKERKVLIEAMVEKSWRK